MATVTYELDQDAGFKWSGTWDASSGAFPTITDKGEGAAYRVTVAGTMDGVAFEVDDILLSIKDSPSTTTFAANWLQIGPGANPIPDKIADAAGTTQIQTEETAAEGIIRMDAGGTGDIITVAPALVTVSQPLTASSGTITFSALDNTVDDGGTESVYYPDASGVLKVGNVRTIADDDGNTSVKTAATADTVQISAGGTENITVTSAGTILTNNVQLASKTSATNDGNTDRALYLDATGNIKSGPIALSGDMIYQGGWDASSGAFPGGGSALKGYYYKVTVAGTVDSVSFDVGDTIFAEVDNASTSTFASNWTKVDNTQASTSYIQDADGNTKIQTEESANENIIRFDVNGAEVKTISATAETTTIPFSASNTVTFGNFTSATDNGAAEIVYYPDASGNLQVGELKTLQDADRDTKIMVEQAADEDTIRMDIGNTTSALTNAFVLTKANLTLASDDITASGYLDGTRNDGTTFNALYTTAAGVLQYGAVKTTLVSDADGDTLIQVEESADEDTIRFDIGATTASLADAYVLTKALSLHASDDVQFSNYPNTRDDGSSQGLALYVDGTGVIQHGEVAALMDADRDTKIMVEKAADEDTIRMDIGGAVPTLNVFTLTAALATIDTAALISGDLQLSNYPNTRNDGDSAKALYVTAAGVVQYGAICPAKLCDTDLDTGINVEATADNDQVQITCFGTNVATFKSTGLRMNDDIFISGSANGVILEAPDGTLWRFTVQNDGSLIADNTAVAI